jgi:hypothetical protein
MTILRTGSPRFHHGENTGVPKVVVSVGGRGRRGLKSREDQSDEPMPWTTDTNQGRARRPAGIATLDLC